MDLYSDFSIFNWIQQIYDKFYFSTCLKMKTVSLRILTASETNNNYCSCKCREGRLNVSTIDLQATQNADISTAIPKANVRFILFFARQS